MLINNLLHKISYQIFMPCNMGIYFFFINFFMLGITVQLDISARLTHQVTKSSIITSKKYYY